MSDTGKARPLKLDWGRNLSLLRKQQNFSGNESGMAEALLDFRLGIVTTQTVKQWNGTAWVSPQFISDIEKKVGVATLPIGGNATAGKFPRYTGVGLTVEEAIASDGSINSSTLTYSGVTSTGTVGESVVFGDVLYLKSDGKYWKALGTNAAVKFPAVVMSTGSAIADETITIIHVGYVNLGASFTPGSMYLSTTTSGAINQTQSTTTGDIVQVVGYATTADIMFFNPNQVWIELL